MVLGDCARVRREGQEKTLVLCDWIGSCPYWGVGSVIVYDLQERTGFDAIADLTYLLQYVDALYVLDQGSVTGEIADCHRERRGIWSYVAYYVKKYQNKKECLLKVVFFPFTLSQEHFMSR